MYDERDWEYEYDGAVPAIPRAIERKGETNEGQLWISRIQKMVPSGAYFLSIEPGVPDNEGVDLANVLVGVVRIQHRREEASLYTRGSGDLYLARREEVRKLATDLPTLSEIEALRRLQLPVDAYRYYLRLESLWASAVEEVLFGFETYFYSHDRQRWERRQQITLRLDEAPPDPNQRPSRVFNHQDTEIGTFRLFKVSESLRHATIQLHAIDGVHPSDAAATWSDALTSADWSVELRKTETIDVTPREGWTVEELRKYHKDHIERDSMKKERPASELADHPCQVEPNTSGSAEPQPWTYHFLIVDHVRMDTAAQSATREDKGGFYDSRPGPLGLMYDIGGLYPGDLARQGAAIAARENVGRGQELQGNEDFYHWAALHELGHMQGLFHNPDRGLMQQLRYLAEFRSERHLVHEQRDARRLRHFPDLWVRPGGVPFAHRYRSAAVDLQELLEPTRGLELKIEPTTIVAGKSPKALKAALHNRSAKFLTCPREEHAQHQRGFLGMFLYSPTERWYELSPIMAPQRLDESQQHALPRGAVYRFEIRWPQSRYRLRQAGLYCLYVYLTWVVERGDDKDKKLRIYHVRSVAPIHVAVHSHDDNEHGHDDNEHDHGATYPTPDAPQPYEPGLLHQRNPKQSGRGVTKFNLSVTSALQGILVEQKNWKDIEGTSWKVVGYTVRDNGEVSYSAGDTKCP